MRLCWLHLFDPKEPVRSLGFQMCKNPLTFVSIGTWEDRGWYVGSPSSLSSSCILSNRTARHAAGVREAALLEKRGFNDVGFNEERKSSERRE